jgi:tetratricopeptide (TPR) repeat protein
LRSGDRWWKQACDERRAKKRYQRALAIEPESARATVRLRAIEHHGDDALSELRARVEDATDDETRADAYVELGGAYWFDSDKKRDAIACFDAAYRADPTRIDALEMLVTALIEMRAYDLVAKLWRGLGRIKGAHAASAREMIRGLMTRQPAPDDDAWPWAERAPLSARRGAG